MSGHSHWSTIKFKKGTEDAKRSKTFSKLSKEISIAARGGGSDLTFNPKLRSIVDKARSSNMPADSIDKAIKKGAGELEGFTLEEFSMEGYGPNGVAIIIDGITDNKNRSIGEIRLILSRFNGKMVEGGGIKWMFDKKGVIIVNAEDIKKDKDEMELMIIDSGAEDLQWQEEGLVVYTKPEDLEKVKKAMEENGLKIASSNLEWVAKETVEVDDDTREKNQKLYEALDDHDDVQTIFWNI
ncbi:MAG: YebC/PmpR family DNA-binding transcriptional regulator [Candidatus Paceibacterota bacterium]